MASMLTSSRLATLVLTRHEVPALFTLQFPRFSSSSTDLIAKGHTLIADRRFSLEDVQTFLDLTGDKNPIHKPSYSPSLSPAPILPGILVAALFPALVGTHFPRVLYASQTLKFRKTALVGEPLRATVIAVSVSGGQDQKVKWETKCVDSSGHVIVEGEALSLHNRM